MATRVLTFRQLESPRHVLELSGPALPLRGFVWGGVRQRGSVRYPSGALVGDTHLHGPEWEPAEIEIRWRTSKLLTGRHAVYDGNLITSAPRLARLVQEMASTPVLCQMEWDGQEAIGYLSSWLPTVERPGDRYGSLEFTPSGWSGIGRPAAQTPPESPVRALDKATSAWTAGIATAKKPAAIATKKLRQVQIDANKVNVALTRGRSVASAYRQNARETEEARGAVAEVLRTAATGAKDIRDTTSALPAAEVVGTEDPSTNILAALFFSQLGRTGQATRQLATLASRRMGRSSRSENRGSYVARAGDDVRLLAWREYGVSRFEVWTRVLRASGLTRPVLSAGDRVIFPHIPGIGL